MTADQVSALLGAVAWPFVALAALVLLREPLTTALTELGRRTTKLDLQVVAFEFAPGIAPDWRVDVAGRMTDVRHLTSNQVFDSYVWSLFDQLARATPASVLVVDLGEGEEWLTTRLYLFCTLLERLRGVECVVLLRSAGGRQRQVLGVASPATVRTAMAYDEPWLESTYASAWHEQVGVVPKRRTVQLSTATADDISYRKQQIDTPLAMQVARSFIRLNQRRNVPTDDPGEWLRFTEQQPGETRRTDLWEHTHWIQPEALPRSLSAALDTRSAVQVDPSGSESDEKRSIMLQDGDFVTLVERDGTLRGVVRRATMLDTAIRVALRPG